MRPEEQLAHADEALRALFARFKEDPASAAFVELSEALLARGHASEAAQVAEHGLQLRPDHSGGRVQRAAALLALGRGRVAYVELLRALAIDPANRRGMRLLGRVYVEAGLPERAAQLLARRTEAAPPTSMSSVDTRALVVDEPRPPPSADETLESPRIALDRRPSLPIPAEPTPRSGEAPGGVADIPELFASLTKDLGITQLQPVKTKVEVTQVMRLRLPRDRTRELSSIQGPIVDNTNPGQIEYNAAEALPSSLGLGIGTAPDLAGPPPLDPEQAALEQLAVRGVARDDAGGDGPDTLQEEVSPIDQAALDAAMNAEAARLSHKETAKAPENPLAANAADMLDAPAPGRPPGNRTSSPAMSPVSPDGPEATHLRRFERSRAAREIHAAQPGSGPTAPATEEPRPGPLKLVAPPLDRGALLLALAAGTLMLAFLLGLTYLARDDLRVWMADFMPLVSSAKSSESLAGEGRGSPSP